MLETRCAIHPVCDRVLVVSECLPLPPAKAFRLFVEESELQAWLYGAARGTVRAFLESNGSRE